MTMSALRMPKQIISWFALPQMPRIDVGATSEMYNGTRADARPIPKPQRNRPDRRAAGEVAVAQSAAPASSGTASTRNARNLPSESASTVPEREPKAAPASEMLTTCTALSPHSACTLTRASLVVAAMRRLCVRDASGSGHVATHCKQLEAEAHQALEADVAPEAKIACDLLQRAIHNAQMIPEEESATARCGDSSVDS